MFNSENNEDIKQAWYAFAPYVGVRQHRRSRPEVVRLLASLLVFVFFLAAYIYPSKSNDGPSFGHRVPECEVYPVLDDRNLTGVITFSETENLIDAKYSVWEKTKERMIYEAEIPMERIEQGSYTIPSMSFWDDYAAHFTEYTGFEEKGDYLEEVRVDLRYEASNGEIRVRTYSQVPASASLCWMQKASKTHGALLVEDGFITEIIHTSHLRNRIRECFVEQPERINRSGIISVRVLVDGQELSKKPKSEKMFTIVNVVRIPIPDGHLQDGSHNMEIYVTQYIDGFKKPIEFLINDTY